MSWKDRRGSDGSLSQLSDLSYGSHSHTKYLGNKLMRATRHTLALLSSVLLFDIAEVWYSYETTVVSADESGPHKHTYIIGDHDSEKPPTPRNGEKHTEYICTYAYVMEEFGAQYPEIIQGYYPEHKREHKRSPLLCTYANESPQGFYWDIKETVNEVPSVLAPVRTEFAYKLELPTNELEALNLGQQHANLNVYLVGFSQDVVEISESKMKFLNGLGYAIYVSAFDLDEQIVEVAPSADLDKKQTEHTHLSKTHMVKKTLVRPAAPFNKNSPYGVRPAAADPQDGGGVVNIDAFSPTVAVGGNGAAHKLKESSLLHRSDSDSTASDTSEVSTDDRQYEDATTTVSTEAIELLVAGSGAGGALGPPSPANDTASAPAQASPANRSLMPPSGFKRASTSAAPASALTAPEPQKPPTVVTALSVTAGPPLGYTRQATPPIASPATTSTSAPSPPRAPPSPMSAATTAVTTVSTTMSTTANSSASGKSKLKFWVPSWTPLDDWAFPVQQLAVRQRVPSNLTLESFTGLQHIGDGCNSNIFLGFYDVPGSSGGQVRVIVKMIKEQLSEDEVALHEFDMEHGVLARLDHPNIVRIIGAGHHPRRFIAVEYLSGGSLHGLLIQTQQANNNSSAPASPGHHVGDSSGSSGKSGSIGRAFSSGLKSLSSGLSKTSGLKLFRKPTFTYFQLLTRAKELAEALDYIHRTMDPNCCIVHRDLKPDNIGFTEDGTLKIFDFGLCAIIRTRTNMTDTYEMTGNTGSLRYMAPEVFCQEPYTERCDVYSFGIILWQMARDRVPFQDYGKDKFVNEVSNENSRPKIDRAWPTAFTNLITRCWDREYLNRPSFAEIVDELDILLSTTQPK